MDMSTPDAATSVLLASSSENAQAGVGGILTIAGQQLVIESNKTYGQSNWCRRRHHLSVHDELADVLADGSGDESTMKNIDSQMCVTRIFGHVVGAAEPHIWYGA